MKSAFPKIAVIGNYMNPETREQLLALARFLAERQIAVVIEEKTAQQSEITDYPTVGIRELGACADLAVVLGGDGTMLTVARSLADYDIPLVGVNRGRFGFLTDLNSASMLDAMGRILAGEFNIEQRMLLTATIVRDGQAISQGRAMNDVVINKSGLSRLIELEVNIDGQFVHKQRSDGIIVATPTGATAYSLSAGGPLLQPTLDAIALVPICPHTLSNRPLVISSASQVEITLIHAEDTRVHFDGQLQMSLQPGDKVLVRRAESSVSLLHPQGHSHYDMLREKLNWG